MSEEATRSDYYMYGEEIDLRRYVEVLLRRWPWIVGCALVAAVAAFGVTSLMEPTYEAEAGVAIVRIRTDVSFEPRIDTVTGEEAGGDLNARRQALVALVSSSDVARSVLEEVGEQLEPEARDVGGLMNRVETSNEGDLISIKATHTSAATAAAIADTWAKEYVRHVNNLYNVTAESEETVAAQVAGAKSTYDEAQRALETFLGDNRMAALEREIGSKQHLLRVYQEGRDAAQAQPVELQLGSRRQVLSDYYGDLEAIERWLADARALRAQVAGGSNSTAASVGDALALISLRNRALGGGGNPVQLQVDLADGAGGDVQPEDVDGLIGVLESRREETQGRIDALAADLAEGELREATIASDDPLSERISALDEEILDLQADLEAEQARQRELEKRRDNAWETYQALAQKEAEVNVQSQIPGTQVRVAASAVAPRNPSGPSKKMNTALAGAVGLMVGVGGVFVWEWWEEDEEAA